mmetsp:Transcript_43601/g.72436  ORF Transcript_43601/g.72436 Transcript_43601/m.72436 type:complete len:245 (+) Transcript_43601:74-808(+)
MMMRTSTHMIAVRSSWRRIRSMARGMKWSSRDRDHFGEHWWTDWLNKLRIKHYLWENPGVWDDQIVGTNMKSTVDSPSWHERAQNKIKYWLGLRNQTIFDVEFEDWHGIYSSRITLENDYMEYLNCFQFSDHIKNENVPGIIVLHDKWGITPDIIHCARFLKSHGYTVYVPDLYRGKRPFSHKDADDMMQRFDLQLAYADIDAAVRYVMIICAYSRIYEEEICSSSSRRRSSIIVDVRCCLFSL